MTNLVENEAKVVVERKRRHEIEGASSSGQERSSQVRSRHDRNVTVPAERSSKQASNITKNRNEINMKKGTLLGASNRCSILKVSKRSTLLCVLYSVVRHGKNSNSHPLTVTTPSFDEGQILLPTWARIHKRCIEEGERDAPLPRVPHPRISVHVRLRTRTRNK